MNGVGPQLEIGPSTLYMVYSYIDVFFFSLMFFQVLWKAYPAVSTLENFFLEELQVGMFIGGLFVCFFQLAEVLYIYRYELCMYY